ncbi:MAG: thiolase family protein [Stappiaceae bacterium]
MRQVFITAAKRTAVVPRGGTFAGVALHELAAPVMSSCAMEAELETTTIDEVIVGNALYGGGNPARLIALAAGLPETIPAITIDRQCCSGLDAVGMALSMIKSGQADKVIAGGAESFSRSALRSHRPRFPDEAAEPYDRPPFSPWSDRDPEMGEAAAALAARLSISRERQWAWAIDSHQKALKRSKSTEIKGDFVRVDKETLTVDPFTRDLTIGTCRRAPLLFGDKSYGVDVATTAVEADAAAFLFLCDEDAAHAHGGPIYRILDHVVSGADPELPGLAPIEAAKKLMSRTNRQAKDIDRVEIMEAYAAQAIAFDDAFDFDPSNINVGGGALARGHPIGASGAILLVQLVKELARLPSGVCGLAAIASAGGLGSAVLIEKM